MDHAAQTEQTRKVVAALYDTFRAGDFEGFAAGLAEDVDWTIEMSQDHFPFCGPRRGREAVVAALRDLTAGLEHLQYEPQFMIADGDRACVLARCEVRDRRNGGVTKADLCDLIQVKDGKVASFREIFDTLTATEEIMGVKARFA
jgi:ketosteroid isomerase-like protein